MMASIGYLEQPGRGIPRKHVILLDIAIVSKHIPGPVKIEVVGISKTFGDDLGYAQIFFDVQPQNCVEDMVRRQRVLVLLIGSQLCARRLRDC